MVRYEGAFSRADNTARCGEIAVSPRGGRDHVFPLCRAMVEAGLPDGELHLSDERGKPCLVVNSIFLGAKVTLSEGDRFLIVKYVPFITQDDNVDGKPGWLKVPETKNALMIKL